MLIPTPRWSAEHGARLRQLGRHLRAEAARSRHRRALLFTGDGGWARGGADILLEGFDSRDSVWLGSHHGDHITLPVDAGDKLLGSECMTLVYDAHCGFDPDSFGAAVGALRAGGLLLLLAPRLAAWPSLPDPQATRIAIHPFEPAQVGGRFLWRLATILRSAAGVVIIEPGAVPSPAADDRLPPIPRTAQQAAQQTIEPAATKTTQDQERAIDAIIATARGRARRPLVLTSDRGRGKTAALGIAAARLLETGLDTIVVTAPRRAAIEPAFRHAAARLPAAEIHGRALVTGGRRMHFLAPDAVLHERPPANLLLVDEAAGIPAPVLEQLLRHYRRIIFATTVHGYEGTGRGFDLRFRACLDQWTPGWHGETLETPIRWAPGDPIEALSFRALLLDAAPAPRPNTRGEIPPAEDDGKITQGRDASHPDPLSPGETEIRSARGGCLRDNGGPPTTERLEVERLRIAPPETEPLKIERLGRDALVRNEETLGELFGLLICAHYQTRPMDLRHLLDGPGVEIYVVRDQDHVIATVLATREGGFTPNLADEVFAGRRRPRGHLLPQTLSAHAGLAEAAGLRFLRVIRIAVHPAARRRRIGRQLLAGVEQHARTEDLDCIGASFGATADLLEFWERCGFAPVHLGSSRNASSGSHAAVVLRPLTDAGKHLHERARQRLAAHLPVLLAGPFRDLEPEIVLHLLTRETPPNAMPGADEQDEITAFAHASRGFEATLPALHRLVLEQLGSAHRQGRLTQTQSHALIRLVLQHQSWAGTSTALGLSGRRECIDVLRKASAVLIGKSD